jgi:oligopeptidase B
MEVPYVDVLQTAGNPALPLTPLEYNEFGNPRRRIEDLEALLELSPYQNVPPEGVPGVAVLCRTAAHDMQVYPYEAVKWIQALRGKDSTKKEAPKLLYIRSGQGHFTRDDGLFMERAQDFLFFSERILE